MLEKLRAKLAQLELDGIWIAKPENIRYLSGFTTPKDAKLLVTQNDICLYTDPRYTVQAKKESRVTFHIARFEAVYEHAKQFTTGKKIGFEADAVLYSSYEALAEHLGANLQSVTDVIEPMRVSKTPEEISYIRKAAQIADAALEAMLPKLSAGTTERDFALELEFEMRKRGADSAAFEIIVASGERSAMPHGTASSRAMQNGDLVTIDWGAALNGYHSDCTRAYPIGEISSQLKHMYNAVLEANLLAISHVKAGIGCKELDTIAREYLKTQGYDEAFAHSLGHGVGLAIHEAPTLSQRAEENAVLETGTIVTIEPGVYLEGIGGVRIEDLLLVTENGCEILTNLPKPRL
jgi:Xaa-Pro aminopeptidase